MGDCFGRPDAHQEGLLEGAWASQAVFGEFDATETGALSRTVTKTHATILHHGWMDKRKSKAGLDFFVQKCFLRKAGDLLNTRSPQTLII